MHNQRLFFLFLLLLTLWLGAMLPTWGVLLALRPTTAHAQAVTPAEVNAGITIQVTTLVDEWDTDPAKAPKSKCSLREALQVTVSNVAGNQGCGPTALSNADEFTIALLPGTYLLTRGEQLPNNTKKVIINGNNTVTIDGGGKAGRQEGIFITGGGRLELSKLKLQNGWRAFGGALWIKGSSLVVVREVEFYQNRADFNENGGGGAVAVETGSFFCHKSKFNENSTRNAGGAIRAGSVYVLIEECEFFRNRAEVNGGALAVFGGSDVTHTTVRNGKFRDNYVTPQNVPATWPGQYQFGDDQSGGGAIYNKGYLEIQQSEIWQNYSLRSKGGGAIYNQGDLFLYDSAISHNKASPDDKVPMTLGGGLLNDGSATILRTSIHHNGAKVGGAILNRTGGRIYLVNSTVADNLAITGGGIENGYNFLLNNQSVTNGGGALNIWHTTIVRNIDSSEEPVGLSARGNGAIYIGNSLVDTGCLGTLASHGGNLFKKNCVRVSSDSNTDLTLFDKIEGSADKIGLQGLKHNGGPNLAGAGFFSIKLKKESAAIDIAEDAYCIDLALAAYQVTKDQIQADRPNGNKCDAGGLEVGTLEPKLKLDPEERLIFPVTVFGEVLASDATLTIKNEGDGTLEWEVAIAEDGGGVFHQVAGETKGTLGKDKDVTLTFRCGPNAPGNYVGSLKIGTNVSGKEEIQMPMSCAMRENSEEPYAWPPQNPPGPLNAGSLPPGGQKETLLHLTNQGQKTLETLVKFQNALADSLKFNITVGGVPIVDLNSKISIPANMTMTVKLECKPTEPGLALNTLAISSNDPINPQLNYDIACEGVTLPAPERLVPVALVQEISKPANMGMALSPDGTQLLAGQWGSNQIVVYAVNPSVGLPNKQGVFSQPRMSGITGIRYSSDGKNVYYTSINGNGVVTLNRAGDGTLSAAQTITNGSKIVCGLSNGNPPAFILCPWNGMIGARALDISPDDQNVYVTGVNDGTLTVLTRRPADGLLVLTQKITRTVEGVNLLGGAFGVLVSPDGRNVYVAGREDQAVIAFTRQADGRLRYLTHYVDGDGLLPNSATGLARPIELAISPDGKFLYVTSLDDDSVQIFERNPVDGFLTPVAAVPVGAAPYHVTISHDPDGERLLVALWHGDAIKVYARDRQTGQITPLAGQVELPMNGPVFLVSSQDDQHVYAALFEGGGVQHLRSVRHLPTLFTLSPAALPVGSSDTLLQVQGANFYPNSQVLINGTGVATSFVNPYRLTAIVPQALLGATGVLNVQVRTAAPGGGDANPLPLTVTTADAPPTPAIASINPPAAGVGGTALNVVVTGSGFTPQSQALLNGGPVATTFFNPNKLLLELTASDVMAPGPLVISVVNGGSSLHAARISANERSLPVRFTLAPANSPAQAAIVSVAPASLPAGSGEQWITLYGHNFSQLSDAPTTALWNGDARPTHVQDAHTLQLLLTSADLAAAGSGAITIRTPGVPDSDPALLPILPAGQNPIAHVAVVANEGNQLLVSGSDFVDGAQVRQNGQPLATTLINPYVLAAEVSWIELRAGGMIDVVNPGTAVSNAVGLAPQAVIFLPLVRN